MEINYKPPSWRSYLFGMNKGFTIILVGCLFLSCMVGMTIGGKDNTATNDETSKVIADIVCDTNRESKASLETELEFYNSHSDEFLESLHKQSQFLYKYTAEDMRGMFKFGIANCF